MSRRGSRLSCRLVISLVLLTAPVARAATVLPPGFVDELIHAGFFLPTGVAFFPDGRILVIEKRGMAWVIENGIRVPQPFLDISDEVHGAADKGLLGVAIHPAFTDNYYVYFLYAVDPVYGAPDEDGRTAVLGRLTRYVAFDNVVDPLSRTVLLGNDSSDGLAHCSNTHAVGALRFARDGSLLVSAGDGAKANGVDFGQNWEPFDSDCEALFGDAQDIGAARSLVLHSLSGKILRIDGELGVGYPTNPFWDGDEHSFQSKVWALGLRNPFRFSVGPGPSRPGTIYVADVGWTQWEEVNVVREPGLNFGWPCYEGADPHDGYQFHSLSGPHCHSGYVGEVTFPLITWNHLDPGGVGFTGNAGTTVLHYDRNEFPHPYRDGVFFGDLGGGWIRFAKLGQDDRLLSIESFAFGVTRPVDLLLEPSTGDLVYVNIAQGHIRRIRYAGGNAPPIVSISADPRSGGAPLTVQFGSGGTIDPNDDSFGLIWDFGDGSPTSSQPNPVHTYATVGTFTATLTATDSFGAATTDSILIETENSPPVVSLLSPVTGQTFQEDELIPLTAWAFDEEDGTNLTWHWEVELAHNNHLHFDWFEWDGPTPPSFPAQAHGNPGTDRYSYRVIVEVTDSRGALAVDEAVIVPVTLSGNGEPVAAFTATPEHGLADLLVQFDAAGSTDPDGDLLFHYWDFGNGLSSTRAQPTQIFGKYGSYDVTLTVTDVAAASSSASSTILVFPPQGLQAYWGFEEGAGTTVQDLSGQGRDLTLSGATWDTGVLGGGVQLDGTGGADLPESLLEGLTAFTLSCWFRPARVVAGTGLVGQEGTIAIGFPETGQIGAVTSLGGEVTTTYPYAVNQWHHLLVTGDGDAIAVYLDGFQLGTGGFSTFGYGSSGNPFSLGGARIFGDEGVGYSGRLDEVRVYDSVLTLEEIHFLGRNPVVNRAPRVSAGSDENGVVNRPVRLSGSVLDDSLPSGSVIFRWVQLDGPGAASFENSRDLRTTVTLPAVGTYTLSLTAEDGEYTAADQVVLEITEYGSVYDLPGPPLGQGIDRVSPNPFREDVRIAFTITENPTRVKTRIFDVRGRTVATIGEEKVWAGRYEVRWDGRDDRGRPVAPGVYFARLRVGKHRYTEKVIRIR